MLHIAITFSHTTSNIVFVYIKARKIFKNILYDMDRSPTDIEMIYVYDIRKIEGS